MSCLLFTKDVTKEERIKIQGILSQPIHILPKKIYHIYLNKKYNFKPNMYNLTTNICVLGTQLPRVSVALVESNSLNHVVKLLYKSHSEYLVQ